MGRLSALKCRFWAIYRALSNIPTEFAVSHYISANIPTWEYWTEPCFKPFAPIFPRGSLCWDRRETLPFYLYIRFLQKSPCKCIAKITVYLLHENTVSPYLQPRPGHHSDQLLIIQLCHFYRVSCLLIH